MKKKATKTILKKPLKPAKGRFKKHKEEEKKGWLDEEKDWKKDEPEEEPKDTSDDTKDNPENKDEDDWIEKENGGYDEEIATKIIDDEIMDDKDNY